MAIRAILRLGLAQFDDHLFNFLVTHDDRIVVVDHEQDEGLTEQMKGQMEELIRTEVESIVKDWLKVHTPERQGISRRRRGRMRRGWLRILMSWPFIRWDDGKLPHMSISTL
jgi:RIO-like serine/threonine protein kinase